MFLNVKLSYKESSGGHLGRPHVLMELPLTGQENTGLQPIRKSTNPTTNESFFWYSTRVNSNTVHRLSVYLPDENGLANPRPDLCVTTLLIR